MVTLIESISAAIILILMVLLVTHLMNKDATAWLSSKFQVAK